jgi:hypothetical protein
MILSLSRWNSPRNVDGGSLCRRPLLVASLAAQGRRAVPAAGKSGLRSGEHVAQHVVAHVRADKCFADLS